GVDPHGGFGQAGGGDDLLGGFGVGRQGQPGVGVAFVAGCGAGFVFVAGAVDVDVGPESGQGEAVAGVASAAWGGGLLEGDEAGVGVDVGRVGDALLAGRVDGGAYDDEAGGASVEGGEPGVCLVPVLRVWRVLLGENAGPPGFAGAGRTGQVWGGALSCRAR